MIAIMSDAILALFDGGQTLALEPGQPLFLTGDKVRSMFLLIDGRVDLVRHTNSGVPLILNRVHPGGVPAEASAFSEAYHCDGIAQSQSRLKFIPVSVFHRQLHRSPETAMSWAAHLAHTLQKARMQCEIRSLKTVSERLDAWLSDGHALPPKGQIQTLAHVLGVSREALYRELSRRRRFGAAALLDQQGSRTGRAD